MMNCNFKTVLLCCLLLFTVACVPMKTYNSPDAYMKDHPEYHQPITTKQNEGSFPL